MRGGEAGAHHLRLKLERALHVQVLVSLHLVDELPHPRVVALRGEDGRRAKREPEASGERTSAERAL